MIKIVEKTQYEWNLKKLSLSICLLALLVLSWMLTLTHPLWETIDRESFRFTNSFIATSLFWQNFWAIASHGLTDWFHDVVVLVFFSFYVMKPSEKSRRKKIAEVLFFAILIAFSVLCINRYLFADVFHIARKSPSMIYDFTIFLSQKIQWLKVKDSCNYSYPGDHGTTALMFVLAVYHLMGRRASFLAFLYSLYWLLPRLVTGAHWLTDLIMGSFIISSFMIALVIYTPIKAIGSTLIYKLLLKIKVPKPNLRLEKS